MNQKAKIARLSVLSNTLLIIMKIVVGIISGSVSILSEAIHSMMDLIAAIIAFFSVRISDSPPDEGHPYGHGKFENVSGVIEAFLILIAAVWIIVEAINKVAHPSEVNNLGIGIGSVVMLISAVINLMVSKQLYKVARKTESIALEADALHLKTDVYTSAGVGIGLILMWITGYKLLDPLIAIVVAIFILKESIHLLNRAYYPLLDTALPKDDVKKIKLLLKEMGIQFHELKTRKAGSHKFLDFHVEMPSYMELGKVHLICDEIEKKLNEHIPHLTVNIHVEPIEKILNDDVRS